MKIKGIVVHGRQLGRTIGFPTANLRAERREGDEPNGVYAAWFHLDGKRLPCMVNIGLHPTLPDGKESVEAHIFDYSGDLYGREACIETVVYLRGEIKFPNVNALIEQLNRDKKQSLALLRNE